MHEELGRALSEQSFGTTSYEILSSSPLKATASVVLLESDTVLISLTGKGFQVRTTHSLLCVQYQRNSSSTARPTLLRDRKQRWI